MLVVASSRATASPQSTDVNRSCGAERRHSIEAAGERGGQ
jgi:hypothetical protein